MPRAGSETGAHQLIPMKLLFAAQATNGLRMGIGGNTGGIFQGWFHKLKNAYAAGPEKSAASGRE